MKGDGHVHCPYSVISQEGSGKLNNTHLQTNLLVDNLLRRPLWVDCSQSRKTGVAPNRQWQKDHPGQSGRSGCLRHVLEAQASNREHCINLFAIAALIAVRYYHRDT
ncbi:MULTISPECIES: hypothetical protein [unclassified Pseudomonas]|uniref:hypothetical protein n=1 Tax=unclassified Pseudomonas TaxID=196821 RepID=UPI0014744C71|nr:MULTISPECIES: hypothetical protein [unclassified Pseudomonas]NMX94694.1 hypothetical protein [Pseudomonas sp. WS 5086]NMY45307.1 hypothetical protein [Pseudomonas sp. WS 5027]